MRAWFACTGAELLARDAVDTVGRLASAQQARGFAGSPEQQAAWEDQIATLRAALSAHDSAHWTIALEYDLLRLEKRIDAVLLTDRAILCLEFKLNDRSASALREAEDYALDLRDFHAGSRAHPIVPMLVAGDAPSAEPEASLLLDAVWPAIACARGELAARIGWVQARAQPKPLDGRAWLDAPYRPVPQIVEAATMLYARHGVSDIAAAGADRPSLTRTSLAIMRHIEAARAGGQRVVIFVTGVPGAGKTLCGLNTVFGVAREDGAAFLTGNAPLVAVLRAALERDARVRTGLPRSEAKRRVKAALQNVHNFLADGVTKPAHPPDASVIVFDEAQRAWDEGKATSRVRGKPSILSMSEPAHALEIMGRRPGWCAIVALIGEGQEINSGEAGLAEWAAVVQRFGWRAAAAPRAMPAAPWLTPDAALDLTVPVRSLRSEASAAWVDAVLNDRPAEARGMGSLPCFVTRSLAEMRAALRGFARGERRAGLLRSSGAKRLRAEGLAAEVTADEVPDWFLLRWPDVRASDALEAAATEYACQGLELDVAGLAWGGDFIREAGRWQARRFVGTDWQQDRKEAHFVRNTYRVLLTRARGETVIWVPPGDAADRTRPPAQMDAIADYLLACGAQPLPAPTPMPQPALLL
jgi:hypothetical protein